MQMDISITRIGVSTYAQIPTKTATGRPIQMWVERRSGANDSVGTPVPPRVHVWPVPDTGAYTLVYWRLRRLQDAGNGINGQDVPFRFIPALVAGLAYHLSLKIPEAAPFRMELKSNYEEAWSMASEEDREKATLRITPRFA